MAGYATVKESIAGDTSFWVQGMSSSALQLSDSAHAQHNALLQISKSIASHRKLSPLFADLYHCLKPLINFDFIGMCLYDPERQVTRLHELVAETPVNCPAPRERPLNETPAHIVIETQQPYYIGDVQQDGATPASTRS